MGALINTKFCGGERFSHFHFKSEGWIFEVVCEFIEAQIQIWTNDKKTTVSKASVPSHQIYYTSGFIQLSPEHERISEYMCLSNYKQPL